MSVPEGGRAKGPGVAVAGPVLSAVSVQVGAGFGTLLLPLVGPVGVVGLRQFFAALALLPSALAARRRGRRALLPALLLGLALLTMNLAIYAAFDRIHLGLAVTLEFLGPLTLALVTSRRLVDLLCGLAAGGGVVLLTGTVDRIDVLGVLLALTAGAAWAAYIVFSARVARELPGVQGTAVASVVATLVTLPFVIVILVSLPPEQLPLVLGVGLAVGVLSSALPYSLDVLVLRRMPRQLFSVLQSVQPAAAALAGFVILGQTLALAQVAGLAAISVANAVAVLWRGHGSAPEPSLIASAGD